MLCLGFSWLLSKRYLRVHFSWPRLTWPVEFLTRPWTCVTPISIRVVSMENVRLCWRLVHVCVLCRYMCVYLWLSIGSNGRRWYGEYVQCTVLHITCRALIRRWHDQGGTFIHCSLLYQYWTLTVNAVVDPEGARVYGPPNWWQSEKKLWELLSSWLSVFTSAMIKFVAYLLPWKIVFSALFCRNSSAFDWVTLSLECQTLRSQNEKNVGKSSPRSLPECGAGAPPHIPPLCILGTRGVSILEPLKLLLFCLVRPRPLLSRS